MMPRASEPRRVLWSLQNLGATSTEVPYLVGGFNPSEKYESVGMIIPYIRENESHVPVTTNQFAIFPELKELTERDRS